VTVDGASNVTGNGNHGVPRKKRRKATNGNSVTIINSIYN
jgi:hypothetical protein